MVHDNDSVAHTETCETCRFFRSQVRLADYDGTCLRYPPKQFPRYPEVQTTDFCGEHQAAYGHGV